MSAHSQLDHHRKTATLLAFTAALAASIGGVITALTDVITVTVVLSGLALILLFLTGMEVGRSRSTTSSK